VRLTVRARAEAKSKLTDRGMLEVTAGVTYTPTGGEPRTHSRNVKLKRH
jgi:hypothetical protein